jgi:sugar diacid utilization regulator
VPDRLRAARRLGLAPDGLARAVAVHGTSPYVEPVPSAVPAPYRTERAGIGTVVPVLNLPSSWADARTALRFTAQGSDLDPGPRSVIYEELGGLVLLAAAMGPTTRPVPDVRSLGLVAATAPWALSTLATAAEVDSLRAAAATLRVHHSTLQYRLTMLERQLGWTVRDPKGRLRLQVALVLRRLHNNLP